jgi:tetratricopeptide (TPR) repeat protein/uncharacterized RDD family membrane protein YckC
MNNYGNDYDVYYYNNPSVGEIGPWPRFWARLLDYMLFITGVSYGYSIATGITTVPGNSLWLNLAAIALWVPVETVLLCSLGTTPGKWLLNISIRDEYGKKLVPVKAFKRSLLVWLCGTWAGIPVLSVIGLVNSYTRLRKGITIWDSKTPSIIKHNYLYPAKVLTTIALICVIGISQYIIPNYDDPYDDQYPSKSFSEAYNKNLEAEKQMEEENYEQAENLLFAALDANPSDNDKDIIYNNLSSVYYRTKDYLKSVDYIEKALNITPNTSVEYSNYGNILYDLGRNQQAEDAYKTAVKYSDTNPYSYYGLGLVNYDRYDYAEAKSMFFKYTGMVKDDPDGWIYLGLSCLYGENDTIKSKEYLDKALELAPANANTIDSMALYYDYTGAKDKAKNLYINALSDNPDDYDLLCYTANYHYYEGLADEAIKYADLAISKNDKDYCAYRIKANACYYNDNDEGAAEAVEKMLLSRQNDPVTYYIAGEIFHSANKYKLAIEHYEQAIEMNPLDFNSHIGIISSLHRRKRYKQCVSFALETEKKFTDANIPWYIGSAYSFLNDSDNAIIYYEKALEMDTDNEGILVDAGWEYFYNNDFDRAKEYANNVLEINSSNYSALNLKESVEKRQGNISESIAEFIEENYMYFQSNSEFDSIRENLKAKGNASNQDILELFSKAYKQDDMFSFVLYDDYYKQYLEMSEERTVESKIIDEDIVYTKISSFSENTANEFLDVIDYVEDPENKYLVIDLRNNSGGDTNSGCNILDYLLPDCVVCNIIHKDGYSNSYYSDEEYIVFRHIFVLTDENSASCSELVTLGLKTYLDNVTVIGGKTFGKGVGQFGYDDKERGLALFIVNHFWNVREINIMDKGIEPDMPVKGSGEECMDEVRKIIAGFEG